MSFLFYYHFSLNQLSYFLLGLGQFLFGKRHTVYGVCGQTRLCGQESNIPSGPSPGPSRTAFCPQTEVCFQKTCKLNGNAREGWRGPVIRRQVLNLPVLCLVNSVLLLQLKCHLCWKSSTGITVETPSTGLAKVFSNFYYSANHAIVSFSKSVFVSESSFLPSQ